MSREVTLEHTEEVEEPEFPDLTEATPEQAMLIEELLGAIDPRKRRALALSMVGYPAFSEREGAPSVASILGVSRKTAETWIRETRKLVLQRMRE